ncbi:MAG: hypothetical protein RLZZ502_661 [Pseudomonadota bacterium]|jgi:pimeloyl-ACP methyl ester carboxylesterase
MPVPLPAFAETHFVLLHANGYPAGCYTQFIHHLKNHAQVTAPDLLTADVCPADQRWPQMDAQVAQTVAGLPQKKIILVAHSMGGYLAMREAVRNDKVWAVVLLDSPLATGWRSVLLNTVNRLGLRYKAGPAPIANRRRFEWPNIEAAREFFVNKWHVRTWAPGVLDDYLKHGLTARADGSVCLRVPRETERDIYAYLPIDWGQEAYKVMRRRGIPLGFIAGKQSREMQWGGYAINRQLFAPRFAELDTSHLIPFDQPKACAEAVVAMCALLGVDLQNAYS